MQVDFRDALTTAKQLLGCELIHLSREGPVGGIIVETEAYLANDPASHAFRGQTPRNAPMFLEGGHIYVYFTYGMHYCFNIVTGEKDDGQAVLVRAIQPSVGISSMQVRRGKSDIRLLANGPAKLVQALGLQPSHNGQTLKQAGLELSRIIVPDEISASPRRGISRAVLAPLRFYIPDNEYVS